MTIPNIYILIFLLLGLKSWSQLDITEQPATPKLILRVSAKKDTVLLRWGTNDQWAWKYGNEYGYILERTTIFRDRKPLDQPEKKLLGEGSIKPKPLNEWEALVRENDMAAVAAQAIYGDSFNVNNDEEDLLMRVMFESSELEQRFAFSMFAVDQDFTAAQYAGLGFVDSDVKPNERYLYHIRLATPKEILELEEVGLLVAPNEELILPKPYDFAGFFYNNAFVLVWEYDALQNFYTAYDLERSEDGIQFSKINEAPITKLAITEVSGISYTDSILEYEKKYWYRIRGRSLFDEIGPVSDTISVIGFKRLLVGAEFQETEIYSEKEALLTWTFPEDEAWKLTGFDVLRSNRAIGPFSPIQENLPKETRSFQYKELEAINYFKVRAKGMARDHYDSSPTMVQPVDSIPPEKPLGLAGTIDTLGVVRLSWHPNTELDLKGYTILRADRPNQEFTRLTKREIRKNEFVDTINLKTFSTRVLYRVMASDNRYNESEASDTLVLNRPNKIPPTNPVFNSYELKGDTILLKWVRSSSENLAKQFIFRKRVDAAPEEPWEKIFETRDISVSEYKDTNLTANTTYRYTLMVENQKGLESKPSSPLSIAAPKKLMHPKVKGLFAEVDRENKFIQVSWRYNEPGVLEIQVFKKEENGDFFLYETLSVESRDFRDEKVVPNTTYGYSIRAVFQNGGLSEWNEITIIY